MEIKLIEWPMETDWDAVKRRALITSGMRRMKTPPSSDWKRRILEARHSPIRRLWYSFEFYDIPSNTATHFARHVHAQPYISSLRNDRQAKIDGDLAPRNSPVDMILDVNAEELMVMANKRLCAKAAPKTREIMHEMCRLAIQVTPELESMLVPMCVYHGNTCHEMETCGRWD